MTNDKETEQSTESTEEFELPPAARLTTKQICSLSTLEFHALSDGNKSAIWFTAIDSSGHKTLPELMSVIMACIHYCSLVNRPISVVSLNRRFGRPLKRHETSVTRVIAELSALERVTTLMRGNATIAFSTRVLNERREAFKDQPAMFDELTNRMLSQAQ